jgi:hypothetical protein
MESISYSDTSDGESERLPNPEGPPLVEHFSLTAMDIGILKGYLQEFQASSMEARRKIMETAMGTLYALRPSGSMFDKRTAKRVRFPMFS